MRFDDKKNMNVDNAVKCESMKDQSNGHVEDHLQKNLGEWTLKYEKLKVPSCPTALLILSHMVFQIQYHNIS
jgi:hypothetical protein